MRAWVAVTSAAAGRAAGARERTSPVLSDQRARGGAPAIWQLAATGGRSSRRWAWPNATTYIRES